jgi:NADPH-dependent curcumin reductase CurA
MASPSSSSSSSSVSTVSLPSRRRKIEVHTLSADFRAATRLVPVRLPLVSSSSSSSISSSSSDATHSQAVELTGEQVLLRNDFVGINASDINFTAGKYSPGVRPPFDAGFESVGVVLALGPLAGTASGLKVGQAVASTGYGAFADLQVVRSYKPLVPLPSADPVFLPLLVSGLTASIALEQVGELKRVGDVDEGAGGAKVVKQQTVLVTAAAGGTGLFAVQLAKLLGHEVVATCSSSSKVDMLRSLGADRVVNYREEDLGAVLKNEYPRGVDVVYESVGGEMFHTCAAHLARKGKLIVIGFVAGYKDGSAWKGGVKASGGSSGSSGASASAAAVGKTKSKPLPPPLPALLLSKSASVRGFFLNDYAAHFGRHMQLLTTLLRQGKLRSVIDPTPFHHGLESVADAIDFLYAGRNVGKVVVDLRDEQERNQQQKQRQQQAAATTTAKSKL